MASSTSMTRVLARINHTKQMIIQWLFHNQPPGMYGALACDVAYAPTADTYNAPSHSPKSVLESIMESTLWASVPKNRRSLEKRLMRKHGTIKHYEAAIPKKNIVACLDCGHWHEKHTICGNCYSKIREETKLMKEQMGDDLKFNFPRSEVAVIYEDEKDDRPKYKGKYIIEMPKPRPQWFPKNLMSPVREDS